MDSYQDYNHGANGLVILNEDGFDRLILGEEGPDPHVGKRIAPFTGLLIHERSGFERGGFGAFPSENGDRSDILAGWRGRPQPECRGGQLTPSAMM